MTNQIAVTMVYVLRDERCRSTFLGLMAELGSLTRALMELAEADPGSYTMKERADRKGWFVEVLQFAGERERGRFDELYCQDRKVLALQGLIDELLDPARSDYVVTRAPQPGAAPLPSLFKGPQYVPAVASC